MAMTVVMMMAVPMLAPATAVQVMLAIQMAAAVATMVVVMAVSMLGLAIAVRYNQGKRIKCRG